MDLLFLLPSPETGPAG